MMAFGWPVVDQEQDEEEVNCITQRMMPLPSWESTRVIGGESYSDPLGSWFPVVGVGDGKIVGGATSLG
jgi:hypothetical protein